MNVEFSESTKVDDGTSSRMIREISQRISKELSRKDSAWVQTDHINFGIPSRGSVHEVTVDKRGTDALRTRTLEFLHQKWVQIVFMSLLILDILIIFVEMFLMIEFPTCRLVRRDCIACCGAEEGYEDEEHRWLRWLASADAGHGDDHHSICPSAYAPSGVPECDSHKYETVHYVENILFYITVLILAVFLVENIVEMLALGPKVFFKQIFLAADFFVVLISLVLEVVFKLMKSQFAELVGILVIFRVWRFIRIGHGIIEVTSELTHEYYDPLLCYARKCEEKLKDANVELPEKTSTCEELLKPKGHH